MSETQNLTKLGSNTTNYTYLEPSSDILECFSNLHPDVDYMVPLIMKDVEFSSLCPKTQQPDWAKIHIFYIPDKLMIESKSLKLYYTRFRNHGEFHEDCINRILKDVYQTIKPKWIRVFGDFNDRGGIAIKPISQKFNPDFVDKKTDYQDLIKQLDDLLWMK